jgi:hypothetical protein
MAQRIDCFAARLIAENKLGRVAGHYPDQHEYQRQHRDERDAREREATDDERGHR